MSGKAGKAGKLPVQTDKEKAIEQLRRVSGKLEELGETEDCTATAIAAVKNQLLAEGRMKTLAPCTPTEFLKQTYRIKKKAEAWLTATDIANIRKNIPELPEIDAEPGTEERIRQEKEQVEAKKKAGLQNFSRMFDVIAGEHPDETMELLGLCCFVEPAHIDDYTMEQYLAALSDMLGSNAVWNFFATLLRLERMFMPIA